MMNKDEICVCAHEVVSAAGEDNIVGIEACATRLKLIVKDPKLVNRASLELSYGVKGVFDSCGRIHVVVGAGNAENIAEELRVITGIEKHDSTGSSANDKKEGSSQNFIEAMKKVSCKLKEELKADRKDWIIGEYCSHPASPSEGICFKKMFGTKENVSDYLSSVATLKVLSCGFNPESLDSKSLGCKEGPGGYLTVSIRIDGGCICVSAMPTASM